MDYCTKDDVTSVKEQKEPATILCIHLAWIQCSWRGFNTFLLDFLKMLIFRLIIDSEKERKIKY